MTVWRAAFLAAVGAGVVATSAPRRDVERVDGALSHDVYVWQRAWNAAVHEAVETHAADFGELVVLAGEVTWRADGPHCARASVDLPNLARHTSHVGLALRVGSRRGRLEEDDAAARFLASKAREFVASARRAGVEPVEFQVDFDAAESQLSGYRAWLRSIRRAVAPVPVTFTALPCWLDEPEFALLATDAGAYVLQVHSLERPSTPDDVAPLCDTSAAAEWVEDAARFGVSFRVALPTYGYLLGFDANRSFLGVSAEGPSAAWPRGTHVRRLDADPTALAGLVRRWTADRPETLAGLIWYRLPVAGEALNWRWPTLARVMRGGAPAAAVEIARSRPQTELVEVRLENRGDADAAPHGVDVSWDAGRLVAMDAYRGFDARRTGPSSVRLVARPETQLERIGPGGARPLGWLRLDRAAKVDCHASR